MEPYLLLASLAAVLVLAFVLGYRTSNKPSLLALLSTLDRERQLLLLTILGMAIALPLDVALILMVVLLKVADPVVIALVSSFISINLTALLVTTYNFWFGSSNGSQLKDAAAADKAAGAQQ